MASRPDPRYYKDANGLRPTWRLAVEYPRKYVWLMMPRVLRDSIIRRRDRK